MAAPQDDAASPAPPPKRVRREYPWRAEFEREFGVRPIQVDAASGDAVLVECRFCVSFGREPPVAPPAPAVNKAGQPVKSRARTRNVAHWKYPFRTDNMRSHHLQQHARKWAEYSALLEQTRLPHHHQAADADTADPQDDDRARRAGAMERLHAFFGPTESVEAAVVGAPGTVTTTTTTTTAPTPATTTKTGASAALEPSPLLSTITNTPIVDAVLPALIDIPSASDADALTQEEVQVVRLLVPVKSTSSDIDEDAAVTQYSIESSLTTSDLRGVVRLLEAGLSFRQVAELTRSINIAAARSEVVELARAFVASGLERVAQLLAASWTYSVRLTAHSPSSDDEPIPLRVNVRVPVDDSRDIETFHVATLALFQSNESKERIAAFLLELLRALDRNFEQKLLSVTVDGATHCLGVHSDLAERIVRPLLTEPVVCFYDGDQEINHAVQSAWALFRDQTDQNASFTDTLLRLITTVRSDSAIAATHPHCPIMQLNDARSVMRALVWLIPRRDALMKTDIDAPLWWWLAAHVVLEVWMDCFAATSENLSGTQRSDRDKSHGIVEQLVKSLTDRCGISTSKEKDNGDKNNDASSADVVEFSDKARIASVRAGLTGNRLNWAGKDIAYCLRALNVSTRRMFVELSKDATSLLTTERQVSRFVLLLVSQLQQQQLKTTPSSPAPPTLPLEFAAIASSDVVDFVETHSRRLEGAFPTVFLDVASREIRDLQTHLVGNEQLRAELERHAEATGASTRFATSWAMLPQFTAVRTLAAGIATARAPVASAVDSRLLAFGRAENGQTPRGAIADLALEAHAHARQLARLELHARRAASPDSLVL